MANVETSSGGDAALAGAGAADAAPAGEAPAGAAGASGSPLRPLPAGSAARPASTPRGPAAARPIPVAAAGAGAARPIPARPGMTAIRQADEDEEAQKPVETEVLLRSAPPWLVSTVVHLILLITLALITIAALQPPRAIRVKFEDPPDIWAEEIGKQTFDKTFLTDDKSKNQEQVFSDSPLPEVKDPLAAPPEAPITDPVVGATSDIKAPDVGSALTGREQGRRGDLLAAYGGTRLTEEAVLLALEWLARQQRQDGSWSLRGPYSDPGEQENVVAATAMALLAFQGHGNTHIPPREGSMKKGAEFDRAVRYSRIVANGWAALGKFLDKDGNFIRSDIGHSRLYTQAQATIALCELYAMTEDAKYKEPAQRAVDYAVKIQDEQGGWRYEPQSDSDTSVSGWFMMALQSARMGKLNVPDITLKNLYRYLDSVALAGGAQYRYRREGHTNPAMSAEGLLCRQYLGWPRNDKRLLDGCDYLSNNPMVWEKRDVYAWYYQTQVLHHMEGVYWRDWNRVMCNLLPTRQVKSGKERGSWEPNGDRWGDVGGRLYVTCLSTYMLEVYYRHLPIYRRVTTPGLDETPPQ